MLLLLLSVVVVVVVVVVGCSLTHWLKLAEASVAIRTSTLTLCDRERVP